MTEDFLIPEFAIVGHPNEGKSTVVSTLSEDDSVRISPIPGETAECRVVPVMIDGDEVIRFIDTPGFQTPKKALAWIKAFNGTDEQMLKTFLDTHQNDPDFRDECQLLQPIADGAGIIYVVDGSRPLRKADKAEMEILRLTGRPRMAIINCKEDETLYLDIWKSEFIKHFNSIRIFNAQKATYSERIALLDSLKSVEQVWQPSLEMVISAFKRDWERRSHRTAELIYELVQDSLTYKISKNCTSKSQMDSVRVKLMEQYKIKIGKIEKKAHLKIRKLFKHNIFNYDLPAQSILNEDLFASRTWQLLGLNPGQLTTAAAVTGGALGAALDVAAAGLTFGIFTAIGSAVGAGSAFFGGERMTKAKVVGLKLGGWQVSVGPNTNLQFLYVLLDRVLLYYAHIINWAHGRRDYNCARISHDDDKIAKQGYTSAWDDSAKKICNRYFTDIRKKDQRANDYVRKNMMHLIKLTLDKISQSEV
jgi:signal recognition particle receptor subunit beta